MSKDEAPLDPRSSLRDPSITGLILAGGRARRMGGRDKAFLALRGKPLIVHVLERLAPQVDEILINANRNSELYAQLGQRVIADAVGDYSGPLAGMEAGLTHARHELLVSVPCDSPFLPDDLVPRLSAALHAQRADVAYAKTGAQPHPVFALMRRSLLAALRQFLRAGGRKIEVWYATVNAVAVTFDDEAEAFTNINTPDELQRWKSADE